MGGHWKKRGPRITFQETPKPIKHDTINPRHARVMNDVSSVRLAVFDCDGTLVDGQHMITAAMRAAFRAEGLPEPAAGAVRRVVGLPLVAAIAALVPAAESALHHGLARRYTDSFQRLRAGADYHEPLFPGAHAALDALEQAGFLLGIATGKSRRGLVATLARHGLERRFAVARTSDDGPGKPSPHMLNSAMAEAGALPSTTVMVGDTVFDIEMARNAKVAAIGVGWGYHDREELRGAGAVAVIDRFEELPRLIQDMIGSRQGG
jgi:phosphoglycolate phosphatase